MATRSLSLRRARSSPFGALAVVLVSVLLLAACSGDEPQRAQPAPGSSDGSVATVELPPRLAFDDDAAYRIGVGDVDLTAVRPQTTSRLSAGSMMASDLLFDGLTAWDTDGSKIVGGLAESWWTSSDGLTWEFTLGSATFANGAPVQAADVKATFTALIAANSRGTWARQLDDIVGWHSLAAGDATELAGVTAPQPRTVRIELVVPVPDLGTTLALPGLGIVAAEDPSTTSGPYEVDDSAEGELRLQLRDGWESRWSQVHLVSGSLAELDAALSQGTVDVFFFAGEARGGAAQLPPQQPDGTLTLVD